MNMSAHLFCIRNAWPSTRELTVSNCGTCVKSEENMKEENERIENGSEKKRIKVSLSEEKWQRKKRKQRKPFPFNSSHFNSVPIHVCLFGLMRCKNILSHIISTVKSSVRKHRGGATEKKGKAKKA